MAKKIIKTAKEQREENKKPLTDLQIAELAAKGAEMQTFDINKADAAPLKHDLFMGGKRQ